MLLVAIAAGACAAWSARQYLQQKEHLLEARSRAPMVERVVAAYDLPTGTRLGPEHLAIRSFPSAAVASDSIPPERFTELSGNFLAGPLRAGDAVLAVHARAPQQNSPFSTQLAAGRRAITIPVDAINSVSGLLHPGDLIDLYVSFEYQRRRITAPLLQGVLVLATGAITQIDAGAEHGRSQGYTTVTLDAAPEDAVKLVAARQSGMITALLRNPQDSASTQKAVRGDLASLLGVSVNPPASKKKTPVIYGNQAVRNVPGLNPAPAQPRQASGVFDLPYMPELVSAWMRAQSAGVAAASLDDYSHSSGIAVVETTELTGGPQ
jgi:pilus assembly protein CpaB